MNILVVTPRYAIAGVPLAQFRFATALAERGHIVTFVVGRCDPDLAMPSAPNVTAIDLGVSRTLRMAPAIWRLLRHDPPDVVFSAEDHLNCVVLAMAMLAGSRAKISCSSRVTPFDTFAGRFGSKAWALKWATRAIARRADCLTCVSLDMVAQFAALFPATPRHCVYNIVDTPGARARMAEAIDDPWFAGHAPPPIVAAGTLAPRKGFADLIAALAQTPEMRLLVLGEGPQRAELQALIDRLGLSDRVRMPGRVANPLAYFARARVFALSSHVEGMPNVLVEAMLCGCTPVATDCPTGPRELLQGGRYGYLARPGDPASIAAALRQALARPIPASDLAEAVRPFAPDAVIARHFALLGLERN